MAASMMSSSSSVLACNYAATSDLGNATRNLQQQSSSSTVKFPVIRAQQQQAGENQGAAAAGNGRRAAMGILAATLFATASSANAGVIEDYLEKSKTNKELNDKKRLATSGANFARAFTVQFGSCKFPENFTGCQDLAKQKKVPFISDDLDLECKGKDKYKCGSNVFWKW
ncbi:unnamed protein product [Linum trigynum]|uniref:Photosystem I reaction center subunit N, chloroplastic n=1 Tax=Linum trigynum TaxID=586398 RepID=A0AAV2E220_9ROSI